MDVLADRIIYLNGHIDLKRDLTNVTKLVTSSCWILLVAVQYQQALSIVASG